MKKKYEVSLEKIIQVEIDEKEITEEVLKIFSEVMWKVKGIEDISKHLSYLAATQDRNIGILKNELVEGLGETDDFGIKVKLIEESMNIAPYEE